MPYRRAVAATWRGACKLSRTSLSFSSSDQRRRRPVSTTSSRSTWALRLSLSIRTVLNTAPHSARRHSADGYNPPKISAAWLGRLGGKVVAPDQTGRRIAADPTRLQVRRAQRSTPSHRRCQRDSSAATAGDGSYARVVRRTDRLSPSARDDNDTANGRGRRCSPDGGG